MSRERQKDRMVNLSDDLKRVSQMYVLFICMHERRSLSAYSMLQRQKRFLIVTTVLVTDRKGRLLTYTRQVFCSPVTYESGAIAR